MALLTIKVWNRFHGHHYGYGWFMGLAIYELSDDMLKWLTGRGLTIGPKTFYDWAGNDQLKQRIAMMAIMGACSVLI